MTTLVHDGDLLLVDDVWDGNWRGPSVLRVENGSITWAAGAADADAAGATVLGGVVLPGFTDSHVHLELVDPAALGAGGIARVLDLGAAPRVVAEWAAAARRRPDELPGIRFAGAFLTAPGGYPAGRDWAPTGSVLELATVDETRRAVRAMASGGASAIKLTLNTDAGPTLADELVLAVVEEAHARALPVVAHAQGAGQALRAAACGVDVLAHAPWTERLSDPEIARLAARTTWISTLGIHADGSRDRGIAIDNLRRFAAAGGRVLYGTDLGNGDLPLGVSAPELSALVEAGLERDAVLAALRGLPPHEGLGDRATWIAGPMPERGSGTDPQRLVSWLSAATNLTIAPRREHQP